MYIFGNYSFLEKVFKKRMPLLRRIFKCIKDMDCVVDIKEAKTVKPAGYFENRSILSEASFPEAGSLPSRPVHVPLSEDNIYSSKQPFNL